MKKINIKGGAALSHQSFSATLGTNVYEFNFNWNFRKQMWIVDVTVDDVEIVSGTGFTPGSNLLHGYHGYGMIFCFGNEPTLDNLGEDCFPIWVSEDEILR